MQKKIIEINNIKKIALALNELFSFKKKNKIKIIKKIKR
jgi:hypothetical protein